MNANKLRTRLDKYLAAIANSNSVVRDAMQEAARVQGDSELEQQLSALTPTEVADLVDFRGSWDASTNTPTLADGTGDAGDMYKVSVAATRDLGSGDIIFRVGDSVFYNGTTWENIATSSQILTDIRYVDASGNDDTGDGSITFPYETLNRANQDFSNPPNLGGNYGTIKLGKGDFDGSLGVYNWVSLKGEGRLTTNVLGLTITVTEPNGFATYEDLGLPDGIQSEATSGMDPGQCLYAIVNCYFDGDSTLSSLGDQGDFFFIWDCAGNNFRRVTNNGFLLKVQNFANQRFTINSQGVDYESGGYISEFWNCVSAQQLILNGTAQATLSNTRVQNLVLNGPACGVTADANSLPRGAALPTYNAGASDKQLTRATRFEGIKVEPDSADFLGRVPRHGKELINVLSSRQQTHESATLSGGDITAEYKDVATRFKPGSVKVQKRAGSINGAAYEGFQGIEFEVEDNDTSVSEEATYDFTGLSGADFDVINPAKFASLAGGLGNCTFVVVDGTNVQNVIPSPGGSSVEVDVNTADDDSAIANAFASAVSGAGLDDIVSAVAVGPVVTVIYTPGVRSPNSHARTSGATVLTTVEGTTEGNTRVTFAAGGTLRWASDGDDPAAAGDVLVVHGETEEVLD